MGLSPDWDSLKGLGLVFSSRTGTQVHKSRTKFSHPSDGFESRLGLAKGLGFFSRTQTQVHNSWTLPILVMGLNPDSDLLKDLDLGFLAGLRHKSTIAGLYPSLA